MRTRKYSEQKGKCFVCHKPMELMQTQLAHRVPQSKINLDKYSKPVIHHEDNLRLVCSLKCNAAVLVRPGSIGETDLMLSIEKKLGIVGLRRKIRQKMPNIYNKNGHN